MVAIDLANSRGNPPIERLEIAVETAQLREMWNGFIQQIVAKNDRFPAVMRSNAPPDLDGVLLASGLR